MPQAIMTFACPWGRLSCDMAGFQLHAEHMSYRFRFGQSDSSFHDVQHLLAQGPEIL